MTALTLKVSAAITALAALIAVAQGASTPASAYETMTDRCSREVAIVPNFGDRPDAPRTVILQRHPNGWSPWTQPFRVNLGRRGHIRWWCHSTRGNWFDPGTWRIEEIGVGGRCRLDANGAPQGCRPDARISLGSSAWEGWTAERSRCGDRSRLIRARLGPNRLLQIACLGR